MQQSDQQILIIVDGSALVTLEDILPTVAEHSWVGGNICTAPGTLKGFSNSLNHQNINIEYRNMKCHNHT